MSFQDLDNYGSLQLSVPCSSKHLPSLFVSPLHHLLTQTLNLLLFLNTFLVSGRRPLLFRCTFRFLFHFFCGLSLHKRIVTYLYLLCRMCLWVSLTLTTICSVFLQVIVLSSYFHLLQCHLCILYC